jgi:hypothetical protein
MLRFYFYISQNSCYFEGLLLFIKYKIILIDKENTILWEKGYSFFGKKDIYTIIKVRNHTKKIKK